MDLFKLILGVLASLFRSPKNGFACNDYGAGALLYEGQKARVNALAALPDGLSRDVLAPRRMLQILAFLCMIQMGRLAIRTQGHALARRDGRGTDLVRRPDSILGSLAKLA